MSAADEPAFDQKYLIFSYFSHWFTDVVESSSHHLLSGPSLDRLTGLRFDNELTVPRLMRFENWVQQFAVCSCDVWNFSAVHLQDVKWILTQTADEAELTGSFWVPPCFKEPGCFSSSHCPRGPLSPAFTFFDPNDPACLEILTDPRTTVPELFAIVRQWVPQVQHKIDVIGNEVGNAPTSTLGK